MLSFTGNIANRSAPSTNDCHNDSVTVPPFCRNRKQYQQPKYVRADDSRRSSVVSIDDKHSLRTSDTSRLNALLRGHSRHCVLQLLLLRRVERIPSRKSSPQAHRGCHDDECVMASTCHVTSRTCQRADRHHVISLTTSQVGNNKTTSRAAARHVTAEHFRSRD